MEFSLQLWLKNNNGTDRFWILVEYKIKTVDHQEAWSSRRRFKGKVDQCCSLQNMSQGSEGSVYSLQSHKETEIG
ncbi:hypothetical protein DY000_02010226 [Brassica cretica]|uniref:Uncharacterized protein n=1 Tax=Brassica cretica TaxID=69181 RepID=A0ABQ7C8Y2_BRACR|nr:hypothetical protein DY000_02010226 [Brassica cretica]